MPDDIDDEDFRLRRVKNAQSSKKKKKLRTGRVYEHLGCGGATQITQGNFTGLCNPFQPVSRTYCSNCSRYVGLDDVSWADTGESISDFRSRMRRKSPRWLSVMDWVIGPVILAGIGIILSLLFVHQPSSQYGLIAGALVGGPLAWWHLVMPDLGRMSAGIEYRNQT